MTYNKRVVKGKIPNDVEDICSF